MYKKLLEILRDMLKKRNDSKKVAAIIKAYRMWKPIKTYKEALKKHDDIASQMANLQ